MTVEGASRGRARKSESHTTIARRDSLKRHPLTAGYITSLQPVTFICIQLLNISLTVLILYENYENFALTA